MSAVGKYSERREDGNASVWRSIFEIPYKSYRKLTFPVGGKSPLSASFGNRMDFDLMMLLHFRKVNNYGKGQD